MYFKCRLFEFCLYYEIVQHLKIRIHTRTFYFWDKEYDNFNECKFRNCSSEMCIYLVMIFLSVHNLDSVVHYFDCFRNCAVHFYYVLWYMYIYIFIVLPSSCTVFGLIIIIFCCVPIILSNFGRIVFVTVKIDCFVILERGNFHRWSF